MITRGALIRTFEMLVYASVWLKLKWTSLLMSWFSVDGLMQKIVKEYFNDEPVYNNTEIREGQKDLWLA